MPDHIFISHSKCFFSDLKSSSQTLFQEGASLTVDHCPSNTTNATAIATTASPDNFTTSTTPNRQFTVPVFAFNVSLPLFSPLPKDFISDRGVTNIFDPWFGHLKDHLDRVFNFTEVGYPNRVGNVFVRHPPSTHSTSSSDIRLRRLRRAVADVVEWFRGLTDDSSSKADGRFRRFSDASDVSAVVDASIMFTDRPPPNVFLRHIQRISARLLSNDSWPMSGEARKLLASGYAF